MEFKLNQRVKLSRLGSLDEIKSIYDEIQSMTHKSDKSVGKIIAFNNEDDESSCPTILVEFDNSVIEFHSADGRGKDKHCYWVYTTEIDVVTNNKTGW